MRIETLKQCFDPFLKFVQFHSYLCTTARQPELRQNFTFKFCLDARHIISLTSLCHRDRHKTCAVLLSQIRFLFASPISNFSGHSFIAIPFLISAFLVLLKSGAILINLLHLGYKRSNNILFRDWCCKR